MSNASSSRGSGRDPNAVGDLWPWVLVVVCFIAYRGLEKAELPAGVTGNIKPALWGGLGLLFLYGLIRARMRQRRRQAERMAAALRDTDLLGRAWDVDRLTVRWRMGKPRVVTVDYPDEIDDRDPAWRAAVVDMIQHRMGAEAVRAKWDEKRGVLIVTRRKPELVKVDLIEEERSRVTKRVDAILAPMFGTEVTIEVAEWRRDEEAKSDTAPSRIVVSYSTMTRDTSDLWRARVETVIGLKLGGRWRGNFEPTKDRVTLFPRPELPGTVPHPGTKLWPQSNDKPFLYYGIDEDQNPRGWQLGAGALPHSLVVGPTGGGKTTVFRSLIVGATVNGIDCYSCDPKRVEISPFRSWPGMRVVASSALDMAELIERIHTLMEDRYTLIEANPGAEEMMRPVLFILDEWLILRRNLNRWWAQNKPKGTRGTTHPALDMVENMLALARTARIHLVIGVQRPDASLFGDGARDNLRHRVALCRLSREGSTMLWGAPFVGVDLPMTPGRAMGSPDGTNPIELQTFWLSDPRRASGQDAGILEELRQASAAAIGDREPDIDVSDLGIVATIEDVPDRMITSPEELPMGGEGEAREEADSSGEVSQVVQDVPVDLIVIGDRVLLDDGDVGTVTSIEEAVDDEDLVELDVSSPAGGATLLLPRESMVTRVAGVDEGDVSVHRS